MWMATMRSTDAIIMTTHSLQIMNTRHVGRQEKVGTAGRGTNTHFLPTPHQDIDADQGVVDRT